MKFIYILLIFCSIFCLSSQCKRESNACHKTIIFNNNSDKVIYILGNDRYPDTNIARYGTIPTVHPEMKIDKESSNKEALMSYWDCYETLLPSFQFKSGVLMIYVFDAHVLENTSWDAVVDNYMVLKRYDLSLQDLENMNWIITYP